MNPAPFQPPPGARLARRSSRRIWRTLARHARDILLAVAALAFFAAAPWLEEHAALLITSLLR